MDGIADDMHRFYTERYSEDDRLRATPHGRLELARMRELLDRYIPATAGLVIDVGGATGVHAAWLAERGHDVEIVDIVAAHVNHAITLPGVGAQVGDARALPFADGVADAVLLLGPLYHLLDRVDRLQALREARRVARPNAPVLAAAISRHAPAMVFGGEGGLDDASEPLIRDAIETGHHDDRLGFTAAHLHTAEELQAEATDAGFAAVQVLGVEGPMWSTLDAHGIDRIDETLPPAIRCARILERDPAMVAASAHLLAIAHAPETTDTAAAI